MRIDFIIIISAMLLTSVSCHNKERLPERSESQPTQPEDPLLKANQAITRTEESDIESYIKRRGLDMQRTASGIRYDIYHEGYGISPVPGDIVSLEYTLGFLNGDEAYNSKTDGLKEFIVDKDDVEPGLHEIVKKLIVGDKALVIIPSSLGYGLVGDGDRIPRYATLVYDLELKSIKKQP